MPQIYEFESYIFCNSSFLAHRSHLQLGLDVPKSCFMLLPPVQCATSVSFLDTIHTQRTVLQPSWILSGTNRVSWYQKGKTRKGKTNLDLLEQETVSCSGISWAICKSARRPRHITTPESYHSVFFQPGCPSCRPTNSVKALKPCN